MFDSKFVFEGGVAPSRQWQPIIFDPAVSDDAAALEWLLTFEPGVQVFDTLEAQVRDLMKVRHPTRRLTPGEIADLATERLAGKPSREHGVWVFYPWSRRLVHLLDEAEFVELRLSRNAFKIT